MNFWASSYLATIKSSVFADANKVQYKVGETWADCTILSSGNDGSYKYFLCQIPSSVSGNIVGIRFVDSNSSVLGVADVAFSKTAGQVFAFKIKFDVKEQA